ncbi:hypothetical protein HDV00_010879 [Rhizophlyctis rosea]|nr:hypothetical protein HDV00_010879 [Rhizophlyctis rosea]
MATFNPHAGRLLPPIGLREVQPGTAAALGGWEPGTVAFPDLEDFVSLLNSATQPQQSAFSAEANGVSLDPLETLLLSAENSPAPVLAQPPLDMDFIFGDVDPLFGSSPSTLSSGQPASPPYMQPLERDAASASPPASVAPAPHGSPASVTSHNSSEETNTQVASAPAETGRKRKLTPEEKEEKDKRRAIRNRAAAQESRDKKKKYMEDLEKTNASLQQQNQQLSSRLESVETTNQTLMSRLEDLASQLTTLRSQFHNATSPTSLPTPNATSITIPHHPSSVSDALGLSDPAAVASQQRISSSARNRTNLATIFSNHTITQQQQPPLYSHRSYSTNAPSSMVSTTTPLSVTNRSLQQVAPAASNSMLNNNSMQQDPSATTPLVSTQAHPLAFIVATAILHSMVSMISRAKTTPTAAVTTSGRRQTLGSDLWTPAEGGLGATTATATPVKRKGLGLLPDLNGYVALSTSSKLSNFPILRSIWENKLGSGKTVSSAA